MDKWTMLREQIKSVLFVAKGISPKSETVVTYENVLMLMSSIEGQNINGKEG
jgi:hypothetical protein